MNDEELKKSWSEHATKEFKGKVVKEIRWLSEKAVEERYWDSSAPVVIFEDGHYLIAQMDDEGNDAGALSTSIDKLPLLPVI